jgi:purine-binding chemotaxis protein CheW
VQEIIRYQEPRVVVSEVAWIRGVISLRGKIIPVCDLASRLGLAGERAEEAKIVVVETRSGSAGIVVDDVDEVLTIEAEQLEDVPVAGADFIEAIAKIDDRLVILLNSDGIFAGAEFGS